MKCWIAVLCGWLLLVGPTLSEEYEEPGCDVLLMELEYLQWRELAELFVDPDDEDDCEHLSDAAADRLEELLALSLWPADEDEEEVAYLALVLAERGLRKALSNGDRQAAQLAMQRSQDRQRWLQTLQDEDGDSPDFHYANEVAQEQSERLQRIGAVLRGTAPLPVDTAIAAPRHEWTLSFGWCGTHVLSFHMRATQIPDASSALVAVGRMEQALQQLLREQWVAALEYGMVPPLLQEFALRAFGEGAYEVEVERALNSVWLHDAPLGREAGMHLFGLNVPLPVAVQSWREEDAVRFATDLELVDWLRPLMLRGAASDAER